MTGHVDHEGRALVEIKLKSPVGGERLTVEAWIDTGFNGFLIVPRNLISQLHWPLAFSGRAILADGSEVDVEVYSGLIEWFGELRTVEVAAKDGQIPLLGVALLDGHSLNIDYKLRTINLD